MMNLRLIFSTFFCLISFLNFGQTKYEHQLLKKDSLYYFNNSLYSGEAVSTFPSGQAKQKFNIKDGIAQGLLNNYVNDPSFNKQKYRDTSIINKLNQTISVIEQEILDLVNDTVSQENKITKYIEDEIGGVKKLEKLREKNLEASLNEKNQAKLDALNSLINEKKKIKSKLEGAFANLKSKNDILKNENGKPEHSPSIETSYEHINFVKSGFFKKYLGKVIIEDGSFSKGLMVGDWIFKFDNGSPNGKGKFVNGDGGNLGTTGIPKNGRDGFWLLYFQNGKIEYEINYVNGKWDSLMKSYFETGLLKSEEIYKQDERNGTCKYYHSNGKLKQEGNFLNDKSEGLIKSYFETGSLEGEEIVKQGERNGLCKYYHPNGKLKQEGNYLNDKADGYFKYYFDSGILKTEENIKLNERNGLCKYYHPNGKLKEEGNYVNGKSEGLFKFYFDTGALDSEQNYKQDELNGLCKDYHPNGKKKREGNYLNDKSEGLFKVYYESGVLQSEEYYKQGERNGISKIYHPNGKKKQEGNYLNDKSEGLFKVYNESGVLQAELNFKNDKAEGYGKMFHVNGKLKQEGNYANGKENGEFKIYDENGQLISKSTFINGIEKKSSLGDQIINKMNNEFDGALKEFQNDLLNGRNFPQSEYDKKYKCIYCKNGYINGWKKGYDKDKNGYSEFNHGHLQTVYSPMGIRKVFPYCSRQCAKEDNE